MKLTEFLEKAGEQTVNLFLKVTSTKLTGVITGYSDDGIELNNNLWVDSDVIASAGIAADTTTYGIERRAFERGNR